jgi:CHAD domain-containing protein
MDTPEPETEPLGESETGTRLEDFEVAAAEVLEQRFDMMSETARGALDVTVPGSADSLWMAAGRLRAALDLFRPVLVDAHFRSTRDEVKAIGRAAGFRRDIDANVRTVAEVAGETDQASSEGLDRLAEALEEERAEANRELARITSGRRLQALRIRVEDLAGDGFTGRITGEEEGFIVPRELPARAEKTVGRRLERLRAVVPEALEPEAIRDQHRARTAAERLRYTLEIAGRALGTQADTARRSARGIQELLAEMRDCDQAIPRILDQLAIIEREDVAAIAERARGSRDLDPVLVQAAPNRSAYRGLQLALVHLRARRRLRFEKFRRLWLEQARQGVWVALEASIGDS